MDESYFKYNLEMNKQKKEGICMRKITYFRKTKSEDKVLL